MKKTILFGGLTPIHERLIEAAVESLGYEAQFLPTPDNESMSVGREFCNRGMCNPTYYTVGNLLKFLMKEREKGIPVEKKYAFVTIGACGPCRFGMYEMEYKHALKEAGFENFTVSILNQDTLSSEGIVELNSSLIWRLVKAVWIADILRDISYQIRPYEIKKGTTDEVTKMATEKMFKVIKDGGSVYKIFRALRQLRNLYEKVEVDFTKVKPLVSVIGEFWAHTTESDGNYNIHRWLEEEGAEVKPEPIAGWIDYQLFMEREKLILEIKSKGITVSRLKRLLAVSAMAFTFRNLYNLFRLAFLQKPRELPSQKVLKELSKSYFDHFVVGGEGHLEVAKHIYNVKYRKAHMVLAVKPFGCMPSTQSDGAQTKVLSDYPETIFISIETSGDGEINVKSRVQMKLFEAKKAAEEEFQSILNAYGLSQSEFENLVKSESSFRNPFIRLSSKGTSTAARFLNANARRILSLKEEKLSNGLPVY